MNGLDFIAIKVGDVNNSARLLGNPGISEPRSFHKLAQFVSEAAFYEEGEEITFDLRLKPDEDLKGAQFTFSFDQDALSFNGIDYKFLSEGNTGLAYLDQGAITVSWDLSGELSQESTLFQLKFTALKSGDIQNWVTLNSRVTKAEAYLKDGSVVDLELLFAQDKDLSGFHVTQNYPNPADQFTNIQVFQETASTLILEVFNVKGQRILEQHYEGQAGNQMLKIDCADLSSGLYTYKVTSELKQVNKRMIIAH